MTRRPVHVQASIRQRAAQLLLSRWDMGLVSHLGKKRQTGGLSLKGNMGNVSLSHSEWCCVNTAWTLWRGLHGGTWLVVQGVHRLR